MGQRLAAGKALIELRELTERELVEGCQREDRRAQEILYGRFARRMYAVCLRYARHELEAQDLMQEGFIRVFEKLPSFRMEGSLEGWVRRIMVHTSINHYRKKAFQNEKFGLDKPLWINTQGGNPLDSQFLSYVGGALRGDLGPSYRQRLHAPAPGRLDLDGDRTP